MMTSSWLQDDFRIMMTSGWLQDDFCHNLRPLVRSVQTCLKHSIFILEQSGSVYGQSQVSLRSVSGQSQVSPRSVLLWGLSELTLSRRSLKYFVLLIFWLSESEHVSELKAWGYKELILLLSLNCQSVTPPVLIVLVAGYSVIWGIRQCCLSVLCTAIIQTLVKCGSDLCLWIVASQLLTSKPFSCHEISM